MDGIFDQMRLKYRLHYGATIVAVAMAAMSSRIALTIETSTAWIAIALVTSIAACVMTMKLLRRHKALQRNTIIEQAKPPYGKVDITSPREAASKLQALEDRPGQTLDWF